jgi:hypothetical protein
MTAAPMDSCVVPHRSTNRAVLWLTAQIGRDAVLSESYGRRQHLPLLTGFLSRNKCRNFSLPADAGWLAGWAGRQQRGHRPRKIK